MTDDVKLENEEVEKTKIELIPKTSDMDKEFNWFDLIKCEYKINSICYEIYLPASFFKIHEFLSKDINIKDKEQYVFNFDCLKVNDKTLKEYFDTCEENKNDINFDILIKYCRPLYYSMNCQSKCDTSFKNKLNGLSQFKHFLGLLFNNINFSIKSSLDIFPKSVFFG